MYKNQNRFFNLSLQRHITESKFLIFCRKEMTKVVNEFHVIIIRCKSPSNLCDQNNTILKKYLDANQFVYLRKIRYNVINSRYK